MGYNTNPYPLNLISAQTRIHRLFRLSSARALTDCFQNEPSFFQSLQHTFSFSQTGLRTIPSVKLPLTPASHAVQHAPSCCALRKHAEILKIFTARLSEKQYSSLFSLLVEINYFLRRHLHQKPFKLTLKN